MKLIIRLIPFLFIIVVLTWSFLFFFYQQTQIYFITNISQGWSKDQSLQKRGNELIDKYEENNDKLAGENGRGILLVGEEKKIGYAALKLYGINIKVSDLVPLNRKVPDSRPLPCRDLVFDESNLPTTAVVIPFHNEWPSILLRTIYSLINRTPRRLLKEIILVDDASSLEALKEPLDKYIATHFPRNLIKMVRLNKRSGLISARLRGFDLVTAEVVSFFDSHMEVNINWLQPLLTEIKKNRSILAMSQLDYIRANTMLYHFNIDYKPRYGFDWRLVFFEDYFRSDQMEGKLLTDTFPGVVMVGAGFAVNSEYFKEIGTYDKGMKIWGGENLELSWRLIDSGNLTDRLMLKERLKCKSFDWYLDNIWPELFRFEVNVSASGQILNAKENVCLDNNNYFYQSPQKFSARECNHIFAEQGFSLTKNKKLRTSLNCVGTQCEEGTCFAVLIDCYILSLDQWEHTKVGQLRSNKNLCLDLDEAKNVIASSCNDFDAKQMWTFLPIST